jgi:polar amino acid transport system substrate-binding protein
MQGNIMNKSLMVNRTNVLIYMLFFILQFSSYNSLKAQTILLQKPIILQKPIFVPHFFDPKQRLEKPDISNVTSIAFLSDDDYPPFHFIGNDGQLTGFNIELARAICDELKIPCTIQARRWDTLLNALDQKQGDAVIASIANTSALRQKFRFSAPYYRTPARFIGHKNSLDGDLIPKRLTKRSIGVIAGSAHEEFLKVFFPQSILKTFNDPNAMLLALKRHEVEFAFGDAIALSFWLNGKEAEACCDFLGGPYTESRFFGEGVSIALRKNDEKLQRAINYALARLERNGVFTTLYLKYFPMGFY